MASETTTLPLSGPISLTVRLGHGSITVNARQDLDRATVHLRPRNHPSDSLDRITVKLEGSVLSVSAPRQGGLADLISGWRRDRDAIETVIEVPADTPIDVASASADITVTGRCGDTEIATTAARISLDDVAGDLRLRYGNAHSRIGAVTGSVQLSCGGGSAQFGRVGGSLDCKFGSGDLTAELVQGDLHARAGKGSAHLGAVYGNVDLAFGAGPISIGLPAGTPVYVDATSGVGQVHTDLPVGPTPPPGGQPITVRARTGAGDIQLRRAAAA